MRSSLVWKGIAILIAVGLFYVGHGLQGLRTGNAPELSLVGTAYAAEHELQNRRSWRNVGNAGIDRLEVLGGWLVRLESRTGDEFVGLTFVPDPTRGWR